MANDSEAAIENSFLTDSEEFTEADLVMPYTDGETFLRRLKSVFP